MHIYDTCHTASGEESTRVYEKAQPPGRGGVPVSFPYATRDVRVVVDRWTVDVYSRFYKENALSREKSTHPERKIEFRRECRAHRERGGFPRGGVDSFPEWVHVQNGCGVKTSTLCSGTPSLERGLCVETRVRMAPKERVSRDRGHLHLFHGGDGLCNAPRARFGATHHDCRVGTRQRGGACTT
jgi:hypothetical protein